MKKLIIILGPTASGKTELSIELAKAIGGECVNGDSTQIYCGTDIATNKITLKEMEGIAHHMISICPVNGRYSIFNYQSDARKIIDDIWNRNNVPIVVGGSGLYIDALIKDYNFAKIDGAKVGNLILSLRELSNQQILERLKELNPEIINQSHHVNNRQRIEKDLAISLLTNKDPKPKQQEDIKDFYKDVIIIGLDPKKELLHININNRVIRLAEKGLFKEIEKAWIDNDKDSSALALKCIGGPEIIKFLENKSTYEDAIEEMQSSNRRYAKKQMTWFKNKTSDIKWFSHNYDDFSKIVKEILIYVKEQLKIIK